MKMNHSPAKLLTLSACLLVMSHCSCQKECPAQEQTKATQTMETRKTTTSGLMYEVITKAPEGAKSPEKGKRVKVHYTGWLADKDSNPIMEKKFDSSVDRGQPFEFILGAGQVIKGWDEGVADMKIGEKRRLVLPPYLAYGERAMGDRIPAHSVLVFDVEVLDCN